MRQNRTLLLAGAFVVLLGVAWLAGTFEGDPTTLDLPEIRVPAGEVDRIELASPAGRVTLVRVVGGWRLEAPVVASADTATVSRLLRDLASARLASIVTRSPDRHARYGVDSTGTEVVLTWEGGSQRLVVSTSGPDYASNYLRVGDDPAVYSSRSRIRIETSLDRLRDRTVVSLDVRSASHAAVERAEERYSLRLEASGWMLAVDDGAPEPADSLSVESWFRRFGPLTADGFFQDVPADSVRALASTTVSITTAGGPVALRLVERDGALAGATATGSDVFRFYSSRLGSIAPPSSTLR